MPSKLPTHVLQVSYNCHTHILHELDRCPYLSYWLFAGVLRSFGALSYPCFTHMLCFAFAYTYVHMVVPSSSSMRFSTSIRDISTPMSLFEHYINFMDIT